MHVRPVVAATVLLAAVLVAAPTSAADQPTISTHAGGLPSGVAGTSVSLKASALAFAPDGDLYIADPGQGVVWRQEPDGTIHHVAGRPVLCLPDPQACVAEGGPAATTDFTTLSGLAIGPDGDVYVSEARAHRIRRIDLATMTVSTVAGTGESGYDASHEGVPATEASLWMPGALDFDSQGNLYLADMINRRIRKIAPDGTITTVAGCGWQIYPECFHHARDGSPIFGTPIGANAGINGNGWGLAVSPDDELYIADAGTVLRVDVEAEAYQVIMGQGFDYASYPGEGEGGPARDARLSVAVAMAFAPDGSLVLAEGGGSAAGPWNRIQRIEAPVTPDSTVVHVGGVGTPSGYSGDGGPARLAQFWISQPFGTWTGADLAIAPDGDVVVADVRNERVRRIDDATGIVTTWAGNGYGAAQYVPPTIGDFQPFADLVRTSRGGLSGDGGPAAQAQLYQPFDVEPDHLGNLYVLDRHNARVRRVAPDGTITTVVGNGCVGERCSRASLPTEAPGDGGPARLAELTRPTGIALDRTGTQLYVVDEGQDRIRQVNLGTRAFTAYPVSASPVTIAPGAIATIFGPGVGARIQGSPTGPNYYGCALLKPYCGEGLPAAQHSSQSMGDVVADRLGNLYVADTYINQVWRIDALTSQVTTVVGIEQRSGCGQADTGLPGHATTLCSPTFLAIGPDGDLYVAETGGVMGPAESLRYGWVDSAGPSAMRIRRVDLDDPLRRSTIIAGTTAGFAGDGGPAAAAKLAYPHGIAVAADGTVYVADTGNHRIRAIRPDGTIRTVAGSGSYSPAPYFEFRETDDHTGCGLSGDGGPAADALLCAPIGLALGPDGTLFVADAVNNRVRAIRGL